MYEYFIVLNRRFENPMHEEVTSGGNKGIYICIYIYLFCGRMQPNYMKSLF